MLVISFSFFGTYSAMHRTEKVVKRVWGKAIDGSKIYEKELRDLAQFLETDAMDGIAFEDRSLSNYCNDGVLAKNILETGIAKMLFTQFFDELLSDGEARLEYHCKFTPYEHNAHQSLPLSSTMRIWQQYAPHLQTAYDNYKTVAKKGFSLDVVDAQISLFLKQKEFTPNLLRQFLLMGERQHAHAMPHDPYLERGNLALFHATTASDWFGKPFLSLVAQYIHNCARMAERRGHCVTLEEARCDLLDNITKQLERERSADGVDIQEIKTLFFRQAHKLNMNEYELTQVWQKILLFRKLFVEVSHCVVLDNVMYTDFSDFAAQVREVELVELPHALRGMDPKEILKWALYLQAMQQTDKIHLAEATPITTEELMHLEPLLVQKKVLLHITQANRQEVANSIGLKELRDWQLTNAGWQYIQTLFPRIFQETEEQDVRFKLLEDLNKGQRRELDANCRRKMVEENVNFIERCLARKEVQKKRVSIPYLVEKEFLPGCKQGQQLLEKLLIAKQKKEEKEENYNRALLPYYTEDGEIFTYIVEYDDAAPWYTLTFLEANKEGVLEALLMKKWKEKDFSFSLQEDLQPHIHSIYKAFHIAHNDGYPSALQEYVKNRKEQYEQGMDIFQHSTFNGEVPTNRLALQEQWRMTKRTVKVKQVKPDPPFTTTLFEEPIGVVSFADNSMLSFYKVMGQTLDASVSTELRERGKDLLGREIQQRFAKEVLLQLASAQHIRISEQFEHE